MMRAAVDRSRSTRGGLITSTGVHALLLLLLTFAARPGGPLPELVQELTKISYIEANLGEDLEKKVLLKMLAKRTPPSIDAGRGISTRSAQKPAIKSPIAKPEPARPKSEVAEIEPSLPKLTPRAQAQLETASRLENRVAERSSSIELPTARTRPDRLAADASGPTLTARSGPVPTVQTGGQLQNSRSTIDVLGGDIDPAPRAEQRGGSELADASSALAPGGGHLESTARGAAYRTPSSALRSGRRGSAAIAETGGGAIAPPSSGSSGGSGRRTILDYGSGSASGGLRSRGGGIARAPERPVDLVRDPDASSKIAEAQSAKIDQDGMGMSITGEIAGRKILEVVAPVYSAAARRKGWEGAVAIHFTVLTDGRVKDNTWFEQTSAHRDLNKAAMVAIKQFKFAPLAKGDAQVEQWGVITFVFRLK